MPWRSVHPHVCGEHETPEKVQNDAAGSSPRVWGTPRRRHWLLDRSRFIPTCVGNTPAGTAQGRDLPVHPHVCGEHTAKALEELKKLGSSPRVWGTLQDLVDYAVRVRFIPTCVGNTAGSSAAHGRGSVHPHVCGEHGVYLVVSLGWYGSSPRVWGTRYRATVLGDRKRFIPTCVGNTRSGTESPGVRPVHPHVCGEHVAAVTVRVRVIGSSPRVWGTHQAGRGIPPGPRFIPTCVGNTPG